MPCPLLGTRVGMLLLAARGEKFLQYRRCVFRQNSRSHFHAMIQLRMIEDCEARLHSATLSIRRAVNQPLDARLNHRASAHSTRFDGDVQRSARQAIIPDPLRSLAQGDHFCVRGGVAIGDGAVAGAHYDLIINHHHCANGHLAPDSSCARLFQRGAHESRIIVIGGNIIEWAHFWQNSMEPLREITRHNDGAGLATVTGQLPIHPLIEQAVFSEGTRVASVCAAAPERGIPAQCSRWPSRTRLLERFMQRHARCSR
jgi:hypothetical protein